MDPNGSCRIRRGRGSVGDGLPNRSGWLNEGDLPAGQKAGKLKVAFWEKHPAYRLTMYPVTGQGTQSVWKHDPNNAKDNPESVRLGRELPIPPEKDASAAPGEETDLGTGEVEEQEEARSATIASEGAERPEADSGEEPSGKEAQKEVQRDSPGPGNQGGVDAKATRGPRIVLKNTDKTWRDRGEELSEDVEPDPEAVKADDPREEESPRKKKKTATKTAAAAAAPTGDGVSEAVQHPKVTLKLKRAAEGNGEDQPAPKKAKTSVQTTGDAAGKKRGGGAKKG